MKKTISTFYNIAKWLIILLLLLATLLVFILESPATVLGLLKNPLKEQNITYGEMQGGLLSGFTLKDVNYNNQVQTEEIALKIDFEALKNRELVIDNLVLKDAKIDKDFLTTLIDSNNSEKKESENNTTLPFDTVLIKNADISLEDTGYQNYYIHSAKLHLSDVRTDMKQEHSGTLTFLLDSNMSQADIKASFKNDTYDILAEVEGERDFIAPFVKEDNLTLLVNPKLTLKAQGDLDAVEYEVKIHKLSLKQNDYLVKSKIFRSKGTFYIKKNAVENQLNTELDGNVAHLKLDAYTKVDLDDLNNTLSFNVDGKITPKKEFIPAELAEQNITIQALPKIALLVKGDLKSVTFNTTIKGLKAKQNGLAIELKDLLLKGSAKPLKGDVKANILTHFNSSVVDGKIALKSSLNYKDVNESLIFDLDSNLNTHGRYLTKILKETNITVKGKSNLKLTAKGDMKNVTFKTTLKGFRAKQNDLKINLKKLELKGSAKPLDGDVKVNLATYFNSSVASGKILLKSDLNYKDINKSLVFDLNANLQPHGKYLTKILKDLNVTVKEKSSLKLSAKGDMKSVQFFTKLRNFRAKQNKIDINLKNLELKGSAKPIKGDIKAKLLTNFKSSVADGEIKLNTKLNFKDVNNSLKFGSKLYLTVHDAYVNNFLKDANVTLRGETPLKLTASGDMKEIKAKLDVTSKIFAQNMLSTLTFKSNNVVVKLKEHRVKGNIKLNSRAENIALKINSDFWGDYTTPKKMMTKSQIKINSFNAFGVNLKSLTPLILNIDKSKESAFVKLNSKAIQLFAKSSDLDHIIFDIKTKKIYPSKIVEVPDELKKKFVKLDLEGDATISKEYLRLYGYLKSNKNFKLALDIKNNKNGLLANLNTQHLKLNAKGNVKEKNIQATLNIDSLTKIQEEFNALYPFTVTPINGSLELKAKLKGEEVFTTVRSPKLKFDGFNVEKIDIDAHYNKELVTLNRLNLETTGFDDDKLNRKFYLNQKGKIHLGERRDVYLDIHPKILVNMKGTAKNLKGDVTIESLPLGHPDYGSMVFSTAIHYEQEGDRKKIQGGVSLEKMKLLYEAKFLDPAHDGDVIVLTKKDKKRKTEDKSFLNNTFIDLAIYAPEAGYKTKDIDLKFTVDVKAKKEFGKDLGLLGKVHEINGRVEQAPKLFTVVDSTVVFRGTKDINPILDIEVEHELADVLITITIYGDLKHPKLEFSSDPQMAKKDILSYLLLGVSTATLSEGSGNLGREAQLFIMNQAARDLAYEVELDRVFIKDDGTGEGYAVQVGKKINDNTMAIIENSKEGNSFILEYEVNKNIKIEVGQHQTTIPSQSIDIFFRKKFK